MSDDAITLYYAPRTRAERVKKLLDVFEIPHELVTVDYEGGEQKSEAYLREVNPLGRVPALRHRGRVILESGAISLYLADLFPEKGMAPAVGTPERGSYYEWFFLFHATLEPMLILAGDTDERDTYAQLLRESLVALADRIVGPHLLGEQFTAADVMMHTELYWYKLLGMYPEGIEGLDAYYEAHAELMNWES